jgi:membrane-associated phospholipid phosphatase
MTKNIFATIWKNLFPVEKLSILYAFITGLYIIIFGVKENNAAMMILYRGLFIFIMLALAHFYQYKKSQIIWFLRYVFPLTLIAYWYPETYYMNEIICSSMDKYFVAADQALFGCQPSMEFSKRYPQIWVNELMNFGYMSYYLFIAATVLIALWKSKECMEYTVCILLGSFFIYFLTFIILPVVGPQFYFLSPDNEIPCGGFFRSTMLRLLDLGEKPTGAFPSSHVGICLICMILIFKNSRKIFYALIPLAIILICSTVYLKAHYLVDVIGGLVSVPVCLFISGAFWKVWKVS